MLHRLLPVVALLSLAVTSLSPDAAAAASVSEELSNLCAEYWEGYLKAYPTVATSLGDKRYDDSLDDITPAGIEKERRRLENVFKRAETVEATSLSPGERLTRAALVTEVNDQLAYLSCRFGEWNVDPLNGPQVDFMNLPDYTTIETPQDAAAFVKRTRAAGGYIDDQIANLRSGLAKGKVGARDAVAKTLDQVEHLTGSSVESLAIWKPATAERATWAAIDRDRFARDLRAAIETSLLPALRRYRDFLKSTILPAARPPEKAGMSALPDGLDCYRRMVRVHTSLDLTPDEIHMLGLKQVENFRRDLAALGQEVFGVSNVEEIQRRLRGSPEMFFQSSAEVESKARETLTRAQAAAPGWFGKIQPKARCEVKVMGMHEAPHSTIAYYRRPSADGKRPGYYMVNTYLPHTRPRYEAEALAFHESIPGHHLQIAVAQELTGLPEFRKHQGVTAYVEGWALYTERLADEMGLYSSDTDRLGMLSYDAWRACRLVVDTGIHAKGWSRQQAIDYMAENSILAPNNIANEVDRYITTPGQALAYKLGQLEILRLRDEAKQRLGSRFDIRGFHDAVLANGAVALPLLQQQIEAYIEAARKSN